MSKTLNRKVVLKIISEFDYRQSDGNLLMKEYLNIKNMIIS